MNMPDASVQQVTFRLDIFVEPDDDGYYAYCPALEGLHVGGDTVDEAVRNAVDAATAYVRSLIKHGDPIPLHIAAPEPHKRGSGRSTEGATRRTEHFSVAIA